MNRTPLAGPNAIAYPVAVVGNAPEGARFGRLRFALFLAIGVALPFYAFPPFRVLGKGLDLATAFAVVFVLSTIPVLWHTKGKGRAFRVWILGALVIPLLCLVPPRAPLFSQSDFLVSYGHWVLMALFFLGAGELTLTSAERGKVVMAQLAVGLPVALFGLYQLVGRPRHWPLTGPVLLSFQRRPFSIAAAGLRFHRPSSVFLEPSWLGGYLVFVFLLGAAAGLETRRRRSRIALAAALAILLVGIFATISWGALIDLGVASAVAFVIALRGGRVSLSRVVGVSGAAVLVLAATLATRPGRRTFAAAILRIRITLNGGPLQPRINPALQHLPGDSATARYKEMLFDARVIAARPLRGVGLGQINRYTRPRGRHRLEPSCGWLVMAAESGLLGPLLLGGALALVWLRWRAGGTHDALHVAAGALVAFAAFEQLHTSSFIDLWWWYPVAVAMTLACRVAEDGPAPSAIRARRRLNRLATNASSDVS